MIFKTRIEKNKYNKEYPYNVQMLHSMDNGKTFFYCGYGRFCKNKKEVEFYTCNGGQNLYNYINNK